MTLWQRIWRGLWSSHRDVEERIVRTHVHHAEISSQLNDLRERIEPLRLLIQRINFPKGTYDGKPRS